MAIELRALNNYSKSIYLYAGSDSPSPGKIGIDVTAGDVVTIYCNGNSDYTFNGYKFIIDEGGGSYSVVTPVETTPGDTGSGWKKAYTIDSSIIEAVELAGYNLYAIPQIDDTQGTFYYFNKIDLSTTPSDIKEITEVLQGIVFYDSELEEYTEFNLSNRFESQHKVLGDSLLYIQTVTQPIEDGIHAGDSVVFDSYGSSPAGITQPNLVFDEEEFDNTGYSYNNLPANTYINIGTPTDGYSPQVILKYGSEPTPTSYTVTFNSNGGSEVASQTVEDGYTASRPENPTKIGCTFYNWFSDSALTTVYDFTTPVTDNITLYAGWLFNITYQYNGGTDGTSATNKVVNTDFATGKVASIPSLTKQGAEFKGWKLGDTSTIYTDAQLENIVFDSAATLTAQWNNLQNTVTFMEGDEVIATVKVDDLTTVKPIAPKHSIDEDGDEFVYWTLNSVEYDFSTPVDNDIILVAYYAQGGSDKWIMSLPNCFVGLKSDVDALPIARVENGTKALAISESAGEETAYIFHRDSLTWIELQHYTVMI